MPIIFDSEKRMFKLDTATSSYIIEIFKENYLVHLYYGAKIPDMNVSMLKYNGSFASFSPQNINIDNCRFSPDVNPMEYPGEGAGDFRSSAVAVRNADGNAVTDMRYKSHKIYGGKPALEGMPSLHVDNDDDAATLEILTEDSVTGVQAVLYYTVFEKLGAMARHVRIINASDKPVEVERVMSLAALTSPTTITICSPSTASGARREALPADRLSTAGSLFRANEVLPVIIRIRSAQ